MSLIHISKTPYLRALLSPESFFKTQDPYQPISSGNSSFQTTPTTVALETNNFVTQIKARLAYSINKPDFKTLMRLAKVNRSLLAKGKAPLQFEKINEELEKISNQDSLGKQEKKQKIEHLRKAVGISKGEMKKLFTQRLGRIYRNGQKSLEKYHQQKQDQFREELRQTEKSFGKSSPQAEETRQKLFALERTIQPQRDQWKQQSNFYHSLYPGFWSQLGGFFKTLGGGILKTLNFIKPILPMVPVLGSLGSLAIDGLNTIVKAVKTKGKSPLNAGLDFIKSKIPWTKIITKQFPKV